MYSLPESDVRQWSNSSGATFPGSFALSCPHCSELATFTVQFQQVVVQPKTVAAVGKCPSCSDTVTVITLYGSPSEHRKTEGIFIHPPPVARQPLTDGGITGTEAVDRAYKSAVRAFNVGLWDACATACRKTLEGIVKTQSNSSSRNLFQQLRDFFSEQDLASPLIHLADTVRAGGNLGAHFDLDKEPDQQVAQMMLDLIDYFLEYLYILPQQSQALENRLEALSKQTPEA